MFNAIPIKIPMTFITEIEKLTWIFICKHKKTMNNQGNTEQKQQHWRYHNIWLQTILPSHSKKTSMILAQNQWNRLEDLDMNPHSYTYLIFDQGTKNLRWRKDSLFNKCCRENWISAYRKLKLDLCLSRCTSISSKWIKDLNVRPEKLKLV
jgi:hypothetical protein